MRKITPAHFLGTLFGEPVGPGELVLRTITSRGAKPHSFWLENLDEAARKVCRYRQTRDVCFGIALHSRKVALGIARRRRPRATKRLIWGSEDSATLLPALVAVIDLARPGRSRDRLLPGGEDALDPLQAVARPPSMVVDAGDRLEVYWRLRQPLVLTDAVERRAARRLIGRVQAALAAAAAERGGRLGPSVGLAGQLHIPGTFNHRPSPAFEVSLEHFPPGLERGEWAYEPADFDHLPEPGAGTEALLRDPGADRDHGPAADFRPVLGGCRFLQRCYRGRTGLPELEWQAALEVIVRCRIGDADGRRLGHRYSRDHPGYTRAGTDAEIERALAAGSARGCRQIAGLSARAAADCAGCAHHGRIEDPTGLARRSLPVVVAEPPAARRPRAGGPEPVLLEPAGDAGPDGRHGYDGHAHDRRRERGRPVPGLLPDTLRRLLELAKVVPVGHPGATPAAADTPRDLTRGLAELLDILGGAASSKEILEQLDAGRGVTLRSALAELFPHLQAAALPTPAQLSAKLRTVCGRPAGGACIERQPRGAKGVRWSVRRVKETP